MYLLTVVMVTTTVFVACKKDSDGNGSENSNLFKVSDLYGTWDATEIYFDEWINVEHNPEYKTSATFNPDGKYSGAGYFGNGSGTYTVHQNTIFISFWFGSLTYDVVTFNSKKNIAEVKMNMGTETIPIRIKKR